jgi:O-phosphoseryl-tRNA synthetase
MEFHAKTIKDQAEIDFEKTWVESAKLLQTKGRQMFWSKIQGKSHPVYDQNLIFRNIFLSYGFNETELTSFIPESEVYKQYGPEAPLILDRVYYLAGISRTELGISDEKKQIIENIILKFDKYDELTDFFRDYKKGEIEGDNFIETMVTRLAITEIQATMLVQEAFPELRNLKAEATHSTLRSHMTAAWFPLLAQMQKYHKVPVKQFSIGRRYRREQKQDDHHLFESTSASIVVMAENITLDDGKDLTKKILADMGFETSQIIPKKTTSKYYAPGMDLEVYVKFHGEDLEVANLGFYSPVSLAKYKIRYPVLNLGFGVERIAMILKGEKDIRKLVYPEIYYNGEVA